MIDMLQRVFYKDIERNDVVFDEGIFKLETEKDKFFRLESMMG